MDEGRRFLLERQQHQGPDAAAQNRCTAITVVHRRWQPMRPPKRDAVWLRKYHEFKGRMGLDFARQALTTPEIIFGLWGGCRTPTPIWRPICKAGPHLARPWERCGCPSCRKQGLLCRAATDSQSLDAAAGAGSPALAGEPPPVQDAADPRPLPGDQGRPSGQGGQHRHCRAWQEHALQPASDADIWLSTAFANLERIVTYTRHLRCCR